VATEGAPDPPGLLVTDVAAADAAADGGDDGAAGGRGPHAAAPEVLQPRHHGQVPVITVTTAAGDAEIR